MKSLARGFQNLGDQQKFLEEFVPYHGVRFINLSSPFIDTAQNHQAAMTLEIPIRGMFNEQYAAVTSEEVRKTFQMKREKGEFIGAFAPYGYLKNPEIRTKLEFKIEDSFTDAQVEDVAEKERQAMPVVQFSKAPWVRLDQWDLESYKSRNQRCSCTVHRKNGSGYNDNGYLKRLSSLPPNK